MAETNKTQVVVVGAGPGGYAAAFRAADLGIETTLVDTAVNPGGVCLYRGCIPSKALLHAAKVLNEAKHAEAIGLSFGNPKIDLKKLRSWKESVVAKMTGGLGQLAKARKVKMIQGEASFASPTQLNIKGTDGKVSELQFTHAILASGSRPNRIPGQTENSPHFWDSTSALELNEIPKTLLVIGGGYIGLELGSVYAALGTEVSVVEMTDGLLPGADRDLANVLAKRLQGSLKEILLSTKVKEMKEERNGVTITFESADNKTTKKTFDKVLISVGRKPNSSGLGLENTKAKINSQGFVEVDKQQRTAEPTIFAIGDVAGNPMLAHKATHEGLIAAEVIAGHKVVFDARAIPAVVFTDPEIAWCGLTETEAKKQNREVKIATFPWAASGRATTMNIQDGLTKLIIDPQTERILGVGLAGAGAGDMIAEGVLAIEMGANALDLALSIHPHPTLSETVMEAAEVFFGQSVHMYKPKRK